MKLDETDIRQSNRLRFCEVIRSWLSFIITLPVSRPLIKLSDQRRSVDCRQEVSEYKSRKLHLIHLDKTGLCLPPTAFICPMFLAVLT